jgi:hypothetical protein
MVQGNKYNVTHSSVELQDENAKNCAHTFVTDIKASAQVDKFTYTAMSGTVNASSSNCQSEKKRGREKKRWGRTRLYSHTIQFNSIFSLTSS